MNLVSNPAYTLHEPIPSGRPRSALLGFIAIALLATLRLVVQARISCGWPAGVTCRGRLKLRARLAVTTPGSGSAPQSRAVTYWIGRRDYTLAGKHSSLFGVSLDREGQGLLRRYRKLRVEAIATVTGGGRRTAELTLHPRGRGDRDGTSGGC